MLGSIGSAVFTFIGYIKNKQTDEHSTYIDIYSYVCLSVCLISEMFECWTLNTQYIQDYVLSDVKTDKPTNYAQAQP